MSELISKDGAIEACCNGWNNTVEDCIRNIKALPSVETTAQYDEFQEDIFRLEKELEYYQERYEAVKRINDSQVETIRTYAAIVNILEKELKELRGELI